MGVIGLSSYLHTRHPTAATTVRLTREDAASHASQPRRLILIDGNGLYHHLLFKFLLSSPRSTGGEWPRFHSCVAGFFRAFTQLGVEIRVCFDGASSQSEGKTGTRDSRANDRLFRMHEFMQKMREIEENNRLPPNCVQVVPSAELLLPVPAHTSLAFHQSCHALGIPCWTSDGENDEHLAAMALQLHRDSGGQLTVDIMGQDSDFLIFEMATQSLSSDAQLDNVAEVGGYVPFDSVRFDITDTTSEASISYKRYTSTSISTALGIPSCLLPTLACLIGNDSDLELSHLHTHLRSPGFTRLLASAGISFTPTKTFSKNNNSASIEANGGFNTSAQLVEAVIAYVQYLMKISREAGGSDEQLRKAIERTLGPGASDTSNSSSSSDDGSSVPTALTAFRDAQLKYSLSRFFTPLFTPADAEKHPTLLKSGKWGVFDAGFRIAAVEGMQQPSSDASHSTTAVLLPSSLLHLSHSSLFPSSLLTALLNREYRSSAVLGDVTSPCVVHACNAGECERTQSEESSSSEQTCLSADQCTAGIRKRMYQLLFFGMDVQPRAMPKSERSEGASSISQLTSALSSMATSAKSALFGASSSSASSSASVPSKKSSASPLPSSSSSEIVIREFIHRCPSAFDRANFINTDDHRSEHSIMVSKDPIWNEPVDKGVMEDEETAGWTDFLTCLSVFDIIPDLCPFLLNRVPKSPLQRRQLLASTLESSCGASKLPEEIRNIAVVMRTVMLMLCRTVLSTRFETPPIGGKLESAVQAQLDRAVIGINTIMLQFAITYVSHHLGSAAAQDASSSSSDSAPSTSPPLPSYLNFDAVGLSQLFGDVYHRFGVLLGLLRCRRAAVTGRNAETIPPMPLPPLFSTYTGTVFHRLYTGTIITLEERRRAERARRKAKEATAAAGGGKQAKKTKVPLPAAASSSSESSASSSTAAPTPSAGTFGIFSLALSNTITDLDAEIEPICVQHLTAEVSPAIAVTVNALFLSLKFVVWSTLGLPSPSSCSNPASILKPILEPLFAAVVKENGVRGKIVRRPVLPYETVASSSSSYSSSTIPPSRSPLPSSSPHYFSLCARSPGPMIDAEGTACDACGWRPVILATQQQQFQAEEGEGSEDEEKTGAAEDVRKHKKRGKKKSGGRGKR